MKQIIAKNAPAAIGPYSHAYQTGNLLFVSGQIGLDPVTGNAVEGGIEEQTRQAIANMGAILEEAGTDFGHVVKTTCFLADMADFGVFNGIYGEYFTGKPARSCFAVKALPKGMLVEIEAIAVVE